MVSAAGAWTLFKLVRIFIFSLSIILSISWTALYIVLLIHGWSSFMVDQRAVILILISIYGISSIILYLMIVVLFRPWMDGARALFLVLFQAGGTAAFFLLRHASPCQNIGPEFRCKTIEDIVIFGGWSLSGLLLFYAFLLAIMSYVPVTAPPPDPGSALAVNLDINEISPAKEKRGTTISVGSRCSQSAFTGLATHSLIDHTREPSIINSARIGPHYCRPETPSSVHSIVPSIVYPADHDGAQDASNASPGSTYNHRPGSLGPVRSISTSESSIRSSTNTRYDYIYPSQVPTPASSIRSASSPNEPSSRQGTPISRQASPLSMVSYQDPAIANPYNQQLGHPRSLTPSCLISGVRGRNSPQPLACLTYGSNVAAPPLVQPFSGSIPLRSTSPWIHPSRSGSGHLSSQSGSGSLVAQSPSPQNLSFNAPILAIPMSAILPAHPGPPISPCHGSRGVHEIRRHSSVPDINVNNTPTYANSHYQAASDYPTYYFAI